MKKEELMKKFEAGCKLTSRFDRYYIDGNRIPKEHFLFLIDAYRNKIAVDDKDEIHGVFVYTYKP